jgi:hypothetical protein
MANNFDLGLIYQDGERKTLVTYDGFRERYSFSFNLPELTRSFPLTIEQIAKLQKFSDSQLLASLNGMGFGTGITEDNIPLVNSAIKNCYQKITEQSLEVLSR